MRIPHASSGEACQHDRSTTIQPHLPTAVHIADGVGCIRFCLDREPSKSSRGPCPLGNLMRILGQEVVAGPIFCSGESQRGGEVAGQLPGHPAENKRISERWNKRAEGKLIGFTARQASDQGVEMARLQRSSRVENSFVCAAVGRVQSRANPILLPLRGETL